MGGAMQKWLGEPITLNHELEREKEIVESQGGFVAQMPGPLF